MFCSGHIFILVCSSISQFSPSALAASAFLPRSCLWSPMYQAFIESWGTFLTLGETWLPLRHLSMVALTCPYLQIIFKFFWTRDTIKQKEPLTSVTKMFSFQTQIWQKPKPICSLGMCWNLCLVFSPLLDLSSPVLFSSFCSKYCRMSLRILGCSGAQTCDMQFSLSTWSLLLILTFILHDLRVL